MLCDKARLNSILRGIRKYLWTRDFLVFLFFVVVSTAFWAVAVISKKRTMEVELQFTYVDFPEHIELRTAPQKGVKVSVRGEGKNFLSELIAKKKVVELKYNNFVMQGDTLLRYSSYKLDEDIKAVFSNLDIVSKQEDVVLPCRLLDKKLVNVVMLQGWDVSPQCILIDSVQIVPSQVYAVGAKQQLDTLRYAYLLPRDERITKSTTFDCALAPINGVNYSQERVRVKANVEVLTEKTLIVGVQCTHMPQDVEVHIFPSEVTIKVPINAGKFDSLTANDFDAEVDYNTLLKRVDGRGEIRVKSLKSDVKSFNYFPQEVEFLLERK